MNEYDLNSQFPLIEDGEEFDFEAIFGTREASIPESVLAPVAEESNPAAADNVQKEPENTGAASVFDKPPAFSYGGAKETIADPSITFEELRIQKADDFPELEEAKSVTWRVRYGTTTKSIADPKGTTIIQIKEEIERSKAFLDSLKKSKDKNPTCLVTPSVTAKSKGIAAYKGVFTSLETARASDKVICLVPSQDGQIFELRKNELGEFIAPKHNIKEFSQIRAGFRPALPRIPQELMHQIIDFFRSLMEKDCEYEALVQIYWDRKAKQFVPFVPRQRVAKAGIRANMENNTLPEDRYLHYADIHSHNSMSAVFSCTDDKDERPTGLYIVIGHLDRFYPEIAARISCGGVFCGIDPSMVLDPMEKDFPAEWADQVDKVSPSCWKEGEPE